MNTFETLVTSDTLICENIKELRIKRVDECDLSIGCNIIIDLLGFRRPYTIAEFDDDSIVILVKNQLNKSRGFTYELFKRTIISNKILYQITNNSFTFSRDNILCISAGIGITPFIKIIKTENKNLRHFHFCKDKESVFYEKYLGSNSKLVVSSEKNQIDKIDTSSFEAVYVCGTTGFIDFIQEKFTHKIELIFESFDYNSNNVGSYSLIDYESIINYEGTDLLNYLNEVGIPVKGDCFQGICGSCVLRYRNADIEHNDLILSDDEKKSLFTPCCSKILSKSIEVLVDNI